MQKGNRPILKKVKHTNFNNPTLNSLGMKGIFFNGGAPPLLRDELHYHDKYKDALEQELEQVETMKHQEKPRDEQYPSERAATVPKVESSRLRYHKNQVLEKVNHIPMDGALDQRYNFNGFRAIKTKQMHGYNIISNC